MNKRERNGTVGSGASAKRERLPRTLLRSRSRSRARTRFRDFPAKRQGEWAFTPQKISHQVGHENAGVGCNKRLAGD